jgi:oligo-1,6-glucosidase
VPPGSVPDVTGARLLLSTHAGAASAELAPWESRLHLIG